MSAAAVVIEAKRWLNPYDLEDEFGISKSSQSKLRMKSVKEGGLPYSKRGKYIFYDRNKIDQWLEEAEMM